MSADVVAPVHAETYSLTRREVSSRTLSSSQTTASTTNETHEFVALIHLWVVRNSTVCLNKTDVRLQIYHSSPGGAVYVLDPGVLSGAENSFEDRLTEGDISNQCFVYIIIKS